MKEAIFICFITNICVAVLMGAIMPVLPALTRKSYLFGVKIPIEEQTEPDAISIKKQYIKTCVLGAPVILALIIAQYAIFPELTIVSTLYIPFLFLALQAAAYIPSWKRAMALKSERGWKVIESTFADTRTSYTRGNLSDLPWAWYALSLIVVLAGFITALYKYPGLPDRVPTHFNANMQPDVWSNKSLPAVLMLPLINILTLLTMWLAGGLMIVRAKLQIDPQNPGRSFEQHRIYRRRIGHSMGFCTLAIAVSVALIGFMSLWPGFYVPFWLLMSLMMAGVVPVVAVSVMSGQGGFKIKVIQREASAGHGSDQSTQRGSSSLPTHINGDVSNGSKKDNIIGSVNNIGDGANGRGDDKYWALGMFYYNPGDPAHIVENRFGFKLGFNYARLPVKIGLALGAAAFVALYAWVTVLLNGMGS